MITIPCACGAVRLEAVGAPMMSVICHCTSCRTAGRAFDARSPVAPIVDAGGGTAVVLWRKDRLTCVQGVERLEAHRLAAGAPSRRMVASCCGTPMFGDFTRGFWVSIYRGRTPEAPEPSMRVMMSDAPEGVAIPRTGSRAFAAGRGGSCSSCWRPGRPWGFARRGWRGLLTEGLGATPDGRRSIRPRYGVLSSPRGRRSRRVRGMRGPSDAHTR